MEDKELNENIISRMLDNLDIKELIALGKEASEKYEVDKELYDFFHREVVEVPIEEEK